MLDSHDGLHSEVLLHCLSLLLQLVPALAEPGASGGSLQALPLLTTLIEVGSELGSGEWQVLGQLIESMMMSEEARVAVGRESLGLELRPASGSCGRTRRMSSLSLLTAGAGGAGGALGGLDPSGAGREDGGRRSYPWLASPCGLRGWPALRWPADLADAGGCVDPGVLGDPGGLGRSTWMAKREAEKLDEILHSGFSSLVGHQDHVGC